MSNLAKVESVCSWYGVKQNPAVSVSDEKSPKYQNAEKGTTWASMKIDTKLPQRLESANKVPWKSSVQQMGNRQQMVQPLLGNR